MYKANKPFGLFLKKNNKFVINFSVLKKQNKSKYDFENTEEKPIIKLSDNVFVKNMVLSAYIPFYGAAVVGYDYYFLKTEKNIYEPLYQAIDVPEIVAKMNSEEKKTIAIYKTTKGRDTEYIDTTHFLMGSTVKVMSYSYILEKTSIFSLIFDNIDIYIGCIGASFSLGCTFCLVAVDFVIGFISPNYYKNMNDMHKIYLKYVVGKIEK